MSHLWESEGPEIENEFVGWWSNVQKWKLSTLMYEWKIILMKQRQYWYFWWILELLVMRIQQLLVWLGVVFFLSSSMGGSLLALFASRGWWSKFEVHSYTPIHIHTCMFKWNIPHAWHMCCLVFLNYFLLWILQCIWWRLNLMSVRGIVPFLILLLRNLSYKYFKIEHVICELRQMPDQGMFTFSVW